MVNWRRSPSVSMSIYSHPEMTTRRQNTLGRSSKTCLTAPSITSFPVNEFKACSERISDLLDNKLEVGDDGVIIGALLDGDKVIRPVVRKTKRKYVYKAPICSKESCKVHTWHESKAWRRHRKLHLTILTIPDWMKK